MDTLTIAIVILSFGMSFLFALGGVGSAIILIPTLTWLGIPFNLARPTGLFVNCVSMLGATYSNIRAKRLDFRLGLPIIISSFVLAPFGAWAGHHLPTRTLLFMFMGFLVFSGSMMLFFKGSKYAHQYREDRPVMGPLLTGVLAGFLSGLLGLGGGGVISPLMILQGFNPKKVTTVTALAVPFSSFSAFMAYAAMGSVSWKLLALAGLAAWAGGYLGTRFMHSNIQPQTVKRMLGGCLVLLAVKLAWSTL
jgi:hypothetical protein